MKQITIGIIREGKIPHDKRVPFTPLQCSKILELFPNAQLIVQNSPFRCYPDEAYRALGLKVQEDLSDCDILIGIKEVPVEDLLPGKKYIFFSHTIKGQPHNRKLIREIVKNKITLIDYECMTDKEGNRIIGFGRYAGIVGAYNGLLGYGKKLNLYHLKPAWQLEGKEEMDKELKKVKLPNIKTIITGGGRVANGATEVIGALKIRRVTPYEFLNYSFHEPVYTKLHSKDYNTAINKSAWNSESFYAWPEKFVSTFKRYTGVCDLLMHCAFWSPKAPVLFTKEDMKSPKFSIRMIADITCDINGSIPATTRPSSIEQPFYDYNPLTQIEEPPFSPNAITIMAVDNLPCELPKDASEDFGKNLIDLILPSLLKEDQHDVIGRATIVKEGKLTDRYAYLKEYIGSEE